MIIYNNSMTFFSQFLFQWSTFSRHWRKLRDEGILEEELIDHVWEDLKDLKPTFISLMEMFDLLCLQCIPTSKVLIAWFLLSRNSYAADTPNSRCCCNEMPSRARQNLDYFYPHFIQKLFSKKPLSCNIRP